MAGKLNYSCPVSPANGREDLGNLFEDTLGIVSVAALLVPLIVLVEPPRREICLRRRDLELEFEDETKKLKVEEVRETNGLEAEEMARMFEAEREER